MTNILQERYKRKSLRPLQYLIFLCWIFIGCESPKSSITNSDLHQAWQSSLRDGKPIFVDFYTDWCRPCKVMDREVYSQQEIGKYLGDHYHAVKFNPEQIQEVDAFGETFKLDDGLGVNNFIYFATQNQFRGYPTAVILSSQGELLWFHTGYLSKGELLLALKRHN